MKTNTRAALFAVSKLIAQAFLLVLVMALLVVTSDAVPVTEKSKSVLLICSEESNLSTQATVEQSLRSTLKNGSPVPLDIYSEYLDFMRTPVDDYEKEWVSLVRRKYEGRKFDLIITVSPTALRVLLKNQAEIFPDTPIVFQVLDQRNLAGLELGPNVTGVWGKADFKPNLDLALMLHPKTRKVVVLAGVSEYDKSWTAEVRKDFLAYEGKLEITYLIGLTIAEQQQALASLPQNTIAFFVSATRDNAGNNHKNPDVLHQISSTSSVPIYGTTDAQLGLGIVGGSILSFEALGVETAGVGLRVLAGEKPQAIAPQGVPNLFMFDWRELRRWGIDESKLPAGSIVRYREPTLWEQYKWRIVGVISLCILEALLIAWLLFTRARRRKAEKESERFARAAEAEHQRLNEVVSNVPGLVWEVSIDPDSGDRKTQFVSRYVEQMLGYRPEDFVGTTGFGSSLIPEADRERVERETNEVLSTGKSGRVQFRWQTQEGRVLWVDSQVARICDETGRPVGVRGVTMDITDRMRAIEALRESEHRFQLASQATKDILYEWNLQTGFVWWNDSAMRSVFGYPLEDMRHDVNWWEERLHPEDKDRINVSIEQALGGADQLWENEYRFRKMDKSYAYVYHRAFIVRGEGGEALRVIGSLMDFTELKQSEGRLRSALEEVSLLKNQLQEENLYLQEEIKLAHNVDEIVGRSNAIKYVLFKIEQVSKTDSTVMILGETGTGKELVARAIHSQSQRSDRPLVKVNCAALSASLIESELFGHEKGAFTGAAARKIGRFELADGATLFLDEIGEMPLDLQSKLLRVIQEGEFERLGSSKTVKVDVRIIAATNRNMKTEVEKGAFREDLWYRLNVFPITVPPLKQRKEDIPPMVEHFASNFSRKVGKNITAVSSATLKKLQDYSWPGNVRELANVIERGVINANGPILHIVDRFEQEPSQQLTGASKTLDEIEKEYITRILDDAAWRIEGPQGAARILGLNPSTLRTRMVKLGIQKGIRTSA